MPSNLRRKIVGLEQLRAAAAEARAASKTVVQCHGCFDIVNPGHIRYLEFARRQGDVLIVSLAGDGPGVDSSSNLSDPDRTTPQPVIPERLRAENLAAL
ncbi:MAG: adenylyltransferase/cytidyltransferase family protein, partial [Phycisphaerae bacterium]